MNENLVDSVAVPKVSIDWYRTAPWWRLASQSLVISWRASHLLLCSIGALLTVAADEAAYKLFIPSVTEVNGIPFHATRWPVATNFDTSVGAPIQVWQSFVNIPLSVLEEPSISRLAYSLTMFLLLVVIWSFVGGCIVRRSLVELGTRLTLPWNATVRTVSKRWLSIVWSISMPIALIALVCFLPLLLGWISNIPWVGQPVAWVAMIPLTFLSVGLGWCGAITIFGFPFSMAAILAEKRADAFDGVSRAAAYIFQRPLTLILGIAAAQLIGLAGGQLVQIVLTNGFRFVKTSFELGSYTSLKQDNGSWSFIALIVPLIIYAFGFSFFWTASSAMYLILRRDVDNTEFDQIDLDEDETPKPLPEIAPELSE